MRVKLLREVLACEFVYLLHAFSLSEDGALLQFEPSAVRASAAEVSLVASLDSKQP